MGPHNGDGATRRSEFRRCADILAVIEKTDPAHAGQAIYTRSSLVAYDAIIYGFNSPILWRCPRRRLVDLYDACVSARHLDIGVGTGRLLDECHFPVAAPDITLMDLNSNSLDAAARRIARYSPQTHRANALEPWGLPEANFDSIGMSYLLHCLPDGMPEKAVVFEHAHKALAPNGTLFGATVLGDDTVHTRLSRFVVKAYNRSGVFSNLGDDLEGLEAALSRAFDAHEIQICGAVALFTATASDPKRDTQELVEPG